MIGNLKEAASTGCLKLSSGLKAQAPGGIPVGWIQPIFQEIRTQMKRTIENPTRKARAVAMLPFLGAWPSTGGALPRIMYNRAEPRLTKMARNAMATRIFMGTLSDD